MALVVGLLLLVADRSRLRHAGALAAASGILLAVHLWWLAPLYVGSRPATTGPALVVLSQNFEYGDPARLAQLVHDDKVDVLVLTDVDSDRVRQVMATDIPRLLPNSIGAKPDQTISSVIFSRFPIESIHSGPHSSHADLVRLHTPMLGDVDLVAVHPQPPYTTRWRPDYRALTSYLRSAVPQPAPRPTIVAGDFNATTDNVPFRTVLDLGYADAVTQRRGGFQPTWPDSSTKRYFGVPVPRLVTIDHVLMSDTVAASSATTVHVAGADHRGVLARIARRGG
ncbi:endonuclease/exonuclease/phosphatase family protein [Flexivirga alba]|uniref:Endonuclease/exonuclease/phosphatase family protein n=1 Tax=Flexivirga alba TaxID=702742 RepID=A0ABW2AFL7_9MICO